MLIGTSKLGQRVCFRGLSPGDNQHVTRENVHTEHLRSGSNLISVAVSQQFYEQHHCATIFDLQLVLVQLQGETFDSASFSTDGACPVEHSIIISSDGIWGCRLGI